MGDKKFSVNASLPLLMTASVSTHGMQGACYTDSEREAQYIGALNFYISILLNRNPNQTIVFAENSDWDLGELKSKLTHIGGVNNRIEFISIPRNLFDNTKGKGYNELLLMSYAVKESSFISSRGAFFKATGRYPILNIHRLLSDAGRAMSDGKCTLYCDIKDHNLYDWLRLGWCGHSFDCRVWAITVERFQREVAPLYSEVNDYGKNMRLLEEVLFDYVKQSSRDSMEVRFKREPVFGGFEGSVVDALSFSKNQQSVKSRFKRLVGNSIRIFTPWFYF